MSGGGSAGALTSGGTSNGGASSAGSSSGGASRGGTSGNGAGGSNSGGSAGRGGSAGSGGAAKGGSTGSGGAASGGSGSGGASKGGATSSGGSTSTSCSFPSGWGPGSPTYTTYDLPNPQTACGYTGSNNNITNIVNAGYYAAIPGNSSSDFNTSSRCGACVQIGSAIVTIIDECPYDGSNNPPCKANPTGHLDLSSAAASAAGVKGDPALKNQAAWKFVPCPVNGNVKVRLKPGNNNEIFIENEILPIASVTCNGQTGSRTSYGAWHFSADINGKSCSATDIANRTINFTAGSTQGQNVDTGVQFPKCN